MRISDWSSDVCSSDLAYRLWPYARGLPDAPQARAGGICDRGDEDYHSSAPEAVARSGIPERRLYDQVAGRMAGEGGSGMKATIWHNPKCGTSRKTLAILEETPGVKVEVIEYLQSQPNPEKLASHYKSAAISPRAGLRTKQDEAKPL